MIIIPATMMPMAVIQPVIGATGEPPDPEHAEETERPDARQHTGHRDCRNPLIHAERKRYVMTRP